MNEQYWQEMFERNSRPQKMPCVDDLFRLAQHDPVVKAYIQAWRSGHMTLEQALIGLVKELAVWKEKVVEVEMKRLQHQTPTPMVVKDDS